MSEMLAATRTIESEIIDVYRDLHRFPELSGSEFRTQRQILSALAALDISAVKAGTTSIIAALKGSAAGRIVALRADIDALPIQEDSGVQYASEHKGVMHACGHDAHTAMLLGAAAILSQRKTEFAGEIRLFFQEAEETAQGADQIIKAGGMDGVDACFGMHANSALETGYFNVEPGCRMAGADTLYVRFTGVSGHGSTPHLAKDTIHPACLFVTGLQALITKQTDARSPIILSVGKMEGGTKANIIAKHASLDISMRYFDPDVRAAVHEAVRRHAAAIADAWGIAAEVRIEPTAISLRNDDAITAIARQAADTVCGRDHHVSLKEEMASEDMPYYFQHAPGAYAFIGYRNEAAGSIYPLHHDRFRIDEDMLKYGAALYAQFALDYLAGT